MSIRRLLFITGTLLVFLPFAAQAERMNYAYVQVTGLLDTDFEHDFFEENGDGLGIRGSWIFGPYAFMDGRYDDVDLGGDIESRNGLLRLGIRRPFDLRSQVRLDIYGMVSIEALELERGTMEMLNDEGVGVTGGLRFGPIPEIEAGLEFNYTDFGNDKSVFYTVEGIWNVSDWFGLVLEFRDGYYNIQDFPDIDRSDLNLGLRIQFGGDEVRRLMGRPLH